jgi:hypothetical protein
MIPAYLDVVQTFTASQAFTRLNNVRFADSFSGADLGAKINAADADLLAIGTVNTNGTNVTWVSGTQFSMSWAGHVITINSLTYAIASVSSATSLTLLTTAGTQTGVSYTFSMPGEIWVSQLAGTIITTDVILSPYHTLRFIQGGTYVYSAGWTLNEGTSIVGPPSSVDEDILSYPMPGVVLQQASGSNLAVSFNVTGPMCVIQDVGIDGNQRGGNNGTCVGILITGYRCRMFRTTVTQFTSDCVQITNSSSTQFNNGIGCYITDCSLSRSEGGNGLTLKNVVNINVYNTKFEANGGWGIRLINSQGNLFQCNDISTNNDGGIYETGTGGGAVQLIGGYHTFIGNGIASPSTTSGASTSNAGILINGWDGTHGNLCPASRFIANIFGNEGSQSNVYDALHIVDTGGGHAFVANTFQGSSNSFRYGLGFFSVNAIEGVDTVIANSFYEGLGGFGTGPYAITTSTIMAGNSVGESDQADLINAVLPNGIALNARNASGTNEAVLVMDNSSNLILKGDPSRATITLQANASSNAMVLGLAGVTEYNNIATVAGGIPAVYAQINLTGQMASTGPTLLYTVPSSGAGLYRVSWYLYVTTAGTGGTVQLGMNWNDGHQQGPAISPVVNLNGNNQNGGSYTFYSASSQNITYSVGVTGAAGNPVYAIRLRLECLG